MFLNSYSMISDFYVFCLKIGLNSSYWRQFISFSKDCYGYKGGSKDSCQYPTVMNVRRRFYEAYPGEPLETFEPEKGDIPLVGLTKFRFPKFNLGLQPSLGGQGLRISFPPVLTADNNISLRLASGDTMFLKLDNGIHISSWTIYLSQYYVERAHTLERLQMKYEKFSWNTWVYHFL